MALSSQDAEGQHIRLADLDPRPKKQAGPREAPPDKPIDGPTTKTEICRAMAVIYNNLIHRPLHDEVRYDKSDFEEEADGLIELMQQHAILRVVMRVLLPIASLAAIFEKVEGTISRLRVRQAEAKRQKQATQAQPPTENGQTPTPVIGLTAEQIAKRPFAR